MKYINLYYNMLIKCAEKNNSCAFFLFNKAIWKIKEVVYC